MLLNLAQQSRIQRISTDVGAGQGAHNTSPVDMQLFEGVMVAVMLGAISAGANVTVKLQQSDQAAAGFADIPDAVVDVAAADDDKVAVIDAKHPTKRYVRAVVTRGGANSAIDGAIAMAYGPDKRPPQHHATVIAPKVVSVQAE